MDPETFQVQRIAFLWAGLGWLGLVSALLDIQD